MKLFAIGALIAGSIAVMAALLAATVLLGPILFWIAWNVLDFAKALGLPELGFWGIVLATLFLGLGWAGKLAITRSYSSPTPAGSTAPRESTGPSRRSGTSSRSRCSL